MNGGRKSLGFTFYVELPTQIKGTPSKRTIPNRVDYIADLVSLERINGESNIDYKARIYDATIHPGGADYDGVVSEIGRALGFIRQETLLIELKKDSSGAILATGPRIDILANRVLVYNDWTPIGTPVPEMEIPTYQIGDAGYLLEDLVTEINKSDYFTATIMDGIRTNSFSSQLVRDKSTFRVSYDYISDQQMTRLEFENIVKGSLEFDEDDIFKTEVFTEPTASGEFLIDYTEGTVQSFDFPTGNEGCSYYYSDFPMTVESSPVEVFSLQDENFTDELFEKKELDSGEQANSVPNEEGSEIYHQLFMNTKVFWGE